MIQHNIEIIIEVNGQKKYLDTVGVESVPITYQISDINDFKNNKSSFSKTITLPLTANNENALGSITNLYSNGSSFNALSRTPCWIYRDSIQIFEGVLEYNGVDIASNEINTTVFSDSYDLWKLIDEKYLTDLDYSRFDHFHYPGLSVVADSWVSDYNNGYYYGLVDWGSNLNIVSNVSTSMLKPLWYVKTIMYQIFSQNGYSIQSDFLNSDRFNNLLVTDGNLSKYETTCQFGLTGSASQAYGLSTATPSSIFDQLVYTIGNFNNNLQIVDPNNEYNTSTYSFTSNQYGSISFYLDYNLSYNDNIKHINSSATGFDDVAEVQEIRLYAVKKTGSSYWGNSPTYNDIENNMSKLLFGSNTYINISNSDTSVITLTGTSSFTNGTYNTYNISGYNMFNWINITPGEEVKFFFVTYYGRFILSTPHIPSNLFTATYLNKSTITKTYEPFSGIGYVNASSSLPKNIKQKDFLNSIFKAFNLFIEPSKQYKNTFIIEPRDDYYRNYQVVKDWTSKIDLNEKIEVEILSNQQKKLNVFKYKEDSDYWNKKYKDLTNRIFGDLYYEIDNYYINDKNEIELLFSPSPTVEFSGNKFGPQIVQQDNNSLTSVNSCSIRLLTRNKNNMAASPSFIYEGVTYSYYPYVGHTDHPTNPTFDLNFAPTEEFYQRTVYSQTDNTLFNEYWYNTVDELSSPSARMLTLFLYLTPNDIEQFKFSDLIYLEFNGGATYWRVNKIKDYDPVKDGTTEVELIEALDYQISNKSVKKSRFYPVPIKSNMSAASAIGNISMSSTNIFQRSGNVAIGANNNIIGTNIIVNGSNNIVS